MAAEVTLAELDIGPRDRVRIFDLIEDQGIWLTFEPLDRLFGWYQRADGAAGIVLNSAHPVSLQRFTAAHELGHHVLGHSFSFDDEDSILSGSRGSDPLEVGAHTFAANLLMPLAAVDFHLSRISGGAISPSTAYQLSVELGVSYAAAVVQLATLDKISWAVAAEFRKQRPLELKTELGGMAPSFSRAAVWTLGAEDDARHLLVDVGDELHIRLPETRSSGFRWVPTDATTTGFEIVNDSLDPDESSSGRYGSTRLRHLTLKAVAPGARSILLDLRRSWESGDPKRRFGIAVDIEPPRVSAIGKGVSVNQQSQLTAA